MERGRWDKVRQRRGECCKSLVYLIKVRRPRDSGRGGVDCGDDKSDNKTLEMRLTRWMKWCLNRVSSQLISYLLNMWQHLQYFTFGNFSQTELFTVLAAVLILDLKLSDIPRPCQMNSAIPSFKQLFVLTLTISTVSNYSYQVSTVLQMRTHINNLMLNHSHYLRRYFSCLLSNTII